MKLFFLYWNSLVANVLLATGFHQRLGDREDPVVNFEQLSLRFKRKKDLCDTKQAAQEAIDREKAWCPRRVLLKEKEKH